MTSALDSNPIRKLRLGIVPTTFVAFTALLVLAMTAIHFHDVMFGEITRSLAKGYVLHAISCLLASVLLLACAGSLGIASVEWLHHRLRKAVFLMLIAPPGLVIVVIFLLHGFVV